MVKVLAGRAVTHHHHHHCPPGQHTSTSLPLSIIHITSST